MAIWPDEARLCLWDLPPRDVCLRGYAGIS